MSYSIYSLYMIYKYLINRLFNLYIILDMDE